MGDFHGQDRWGFKLVFPQVRWDHVLERGHFEQRRGIWQTVMTAFVSSTLVIDNPPLDESRMDGPERTAHFRYISSLPELQTNIIFPVIEKSEPYAFPGGTTLPAGTRIAWSAYTTETIPTDGEVLYKWPPDE